MEIPVSIILAFTPFALWGLERGLDRVSVLGKDGLVTSMKEDSREHVQDYANDLLSIEDIGNYYKFDEDARKVVQVCLLNVGSIFFAQFECSDSIFFVPTFHVITIILYFCFFAVFVLKISSRKLLPANPDNVKSWLKF